MKRQVRDYIVQNLLMGADAGDLADDTSFLERSLIDSTGVLELVAYLEETFGIQVGDDEMTPENLDSLDAIEAYVTAKQARRAAAS